MKSFYIFERLDHMHENKTFFFVFHIYIYIYCNISEKTEYFNTKFIFLQYKYTNQY